MYQLQAIALMRQLLIFLIFVFGLAAGADAAMTPLGLYTRVNSDQSCLQYKITGVCRKGGVPVGYMVSMNVPVAFVETLPGPGDSLLAIPNFTALLSTIVGKGLSVGQSNNSGMDNSFEVKVWQLPNTVMLLSSILPKCLVCMPSDAVDLAQPLPELPSSGCEGLTAATSKLTSLTQSLTAIPLMPSLSYASEADLLNWRTGCRDVTLTNWLKSNPVTCSASSVAETADKITKKLGAGSNLKNYFDEDACLGAWGQLYPRQMRDVGNVPTISSAKAAYRALSLAKRQFGSFNYPVNRAGKFQQAYPNVSACFNPGASPLPSLPLTTKPVLSSTDGSYGWIYWRPVSCCISYTALAKCMKLQKN